MTTHRQFISNSDDHHRMIDMIRQQMKTATTLDIAVSFARYSGTQLLLDAFAAFARRGGQARILASDYMGITQREALVALEQFDNVTCRIFLASAQQGFHAKMYIFGQGDPTQCWVGSSNFSKGGLATNLEANLRRDDPDAIEATKSFFERMWSLSNTIDLAAWRPSPQPPNTFVHTPYNLAHTPQNQTPTLTPNTAQNEALQQLQRLRDVGERRAVVIAATGVGKTLLAAFDAQAASAKRVLFLSHRLEHLLQAQSAFEHILGHTHSVGVLHSTQQDLHADILCATVRSALSAIERGALEPDMDYVVIDEFHHAIAQSYQNILGALDTSFLLGLTATPERTDGHDVLAICDHNIAYEARLVEAIDRGWLVPFHYFGIADELVDYDTLPWRSGRFDPNALELALMVESRVAYILHHVTMKGFDGPRRAGVGFCAGIKHAKFMANAFNAKGHSAIALTGEDALATRHEAYARLQNPQDPLEWIFVADLLNEGVDIPAINTLLFLRPTDSPTVFLQQLGRGLRQHPSCEVLTVLDFVGHHRNAWLTIEALNANNAPPGPRTLTTLDLTPPKDCEIILDDHTIEILTQIKQQEQRVSFRQQCLDAYARLKEQIDTPMPIDLWGRQDMPPWSAFKQQSWLSIRATHQDTTPWEDVLLEHPDHPLHVLLHAAEKDWQQQRVYLYALFWALCAATPTRDVEHTYELFYDRFPRWRVEYRAFDQLTEKNWTTARKKLPLLEGQRSLELSSIIDDLPSLTHEELLRHIEGRLKLTLARDYQKRHNGVLKTLNDLQRHHQYSRPEIIRHFGVQYDPTRHNKGVLTFEDMPGHRALISKIDTSTAPEAHQYINRFITSDRFAWQSQNNHHPEHGAGQLLVEHQHHGITLHLFVQPKSGTRAYYIGEVRVLSHEHGQKKGEPIDIIFELAHALPPTLWSILGLPESTHL